MRSIPAILLSCLLCVGARAFGAALDAPVPNYALHVLIEPAQHRMAVRGRITIPPGVAGEGHTLALSRWMDHVEFLEAMSDGTRRRLAEAPAAAGGSATRTYRLLEEPSAKHPVELLVSYESSNTTGFVFNLQGPVYFADGADTAWYPVVGSETRGTGEIDFAVPPGMSVVASPSRQPDGRTFLAKAPINLSFAAGPYHRTQVSGAVPVSIYALKARPDVQDYANRVQSTLRTLTQAFGSPPLDEFAIVEIPTEEASKSGFGGASSPGMIFMNSNALDGGFSLPFFAHEIGHQWWGNLITNNGSTGREMLGEAMAQWGALYVVEKVEGPAAATAFRKTGYAGYVTTQSAQGYFNISAAGLDHPLSMLPDGVVGHELANSKGFIVYNQLAAEIGEGQFIKALHAITRDYSRRDLPWPTFLKAVQQASGRDLSRFYDQWFNRIGAPTFESSWVQSGATVQLTVRQKGEPYTARVDLMLRGEHGEQMLRQIVIDGAEERLKIERIPFHVSKVELDPDYRILHWTQTMKAKAAALAGVTAADLSNDDTAKAAGYKRALESAQAGVDVWGAGFLAEEGLAKSAMNEGKWSEVKIHLLNAVAKPSRPESELPLVYFLLAMTAQHLADDTLLQQAKSAAAAADAMLDHPTGAGKAARALTIDRGPDHK